MVAAVASMTSMTSHVISSWRYNTIQSCVNPCKILLLLLYTCMIVRLAIWQNLTSLVSCLHVYTILTSQGKAGRIKPEHSPKPTLKPSPWQYPVKVTMSPSSRKVRCCPSFKSTVLVPDHEASRRLPTPCSAWKAATACCKLGNCRQEPLNCIAHFWNASRRAVKHTECLCNAWLQCNAFQVSTLSWNETTCEMVT